MKGPFEDSLKHFKVDNISLLNLDVDLYKSFKLCLEKFIPRFLKEVWSLLMNISEKVMPYHGALKSIEEYFEDKDVEFVKENCYGKFYVIKDSCSD